MPSQLILSIVEEIRVLAQSATLEDFKRILEVKFNSLSKPERKELFKSLALIYHPDKEGGDTRKCQILNNVYKQSTFELKIALDNPLYLFNTAKEWIFPQFKKLNRYPAIVQRIMEVIFWLIVVPVGLGVVIAVVLLGLLSILISFPTRLASVVTKQSIANMVRAYKEANSEAYEKNKTEFISVQKTKQMMHLQIKLDVQRIREGGEPKEIEQLQGDLNRLYESDDEAFWNLYCGNLPEEAETNLNDYILNQRLNRISLPIKAFWSTINVSSNSLLYRFGVALAGVILLPIISVGSLVNICVVKPLDIALQVILCGVPCLLVSVFTLPLNIIDFISSTSRIPKKSTEQPSAAHNDEENDNESQMAALHQNRSSEERVEPPSFGYESRRGQAASNTPNLSNSQLSLPGLD